VASGPNLLPATSGVPPIASRAAEAGAAQAEDAGRCCRARRINEIVHGKRAVAADRPASRALTSKRRRASGSTCRPSTTSTPKPTASATAWTTSHHPRRLNIEKRRSQNGSPALAGRAEWRRRAGPPRCHPPSGGEVGQDIPFGHAFCKHADDHGDGDARAADAGTPAMVR
jgi:hypothetical protein